jgi:beta-barrel assembly-enhancing protease
MTTPHPRLPSKALALLLILATPLQLFARYQPTSGANAFSRDQELQAGQEASADVLKKMPVLPEGDPVTLYIQKLGGQLTAHAPGDPWPYHFRVVNQKEINAFALPGGPIFVNMGTIQAADNEAELAGVMAHEISHVVQRHATRAATKQMKVQMPLQILGALLGRSSLGELAAAGISFGAGSYFMKNSRQNESEADLIGTDIMYDSGYNPQAMADFFTKLEKQGGANGPQFLSDHPNPGNRAGAVEKEVRSLPAKSYRGGGPEFAQIKQRVAGIKALTAQEIAAQQQAQTQSIKGRLPAAEYPSRDTQSFTHDLYQITYPKNWQAFGDRTSTVNIAPPSGVSDNAIAYGVLISDYQTENKADTLDQSLHELLTSLRQSNQDMKQVGNDENIRVAGVAGKSVDLIATSPVQDANGKAQRERDWLVAVPGRQGNLIYLVFIAPDADFNTLRPTFDQMLRSLRIK